MSSGYPTRTIVGQHSPGIMKSSTTTSNSTYSASSTSGGVVNGGPPSSAIHSSNPANTIMTAPHLAAGAHAVNPFATDPLAPPDWIQKHLEEFAKTVPEAYRPYLAWPHLPTTTTGGQHHLAAPAHLPPHPANAFPSIPPPFSTHNQTICHSPQCPFGTSTLSANLATEPFKHAPFANNAAAMAADEIIDSDPVNYEIRVDTSGFKPEEVNVSVTDQTVTISGEQKAGEANDQGNHKQQAWSQKQFRRSYTLPPNVQVDRLTCEMSGDGKLSIKAPKRTPPPPAITFGGSSVPIKVTFDK